MKTCWRGGGENRSNKKEKEKTQTNTQFSATYGPGRKSYGDTKRTALATSTVTFSTKGNLHLIGPAKTKATKMAAAFGSLASVV